MNTLNTIKSYLKTMHKNFLSFFSIFSTQTVTQIFFPPAMILTWGVEKFGIWILIVSILPMLTILNINFALASRSEMSINLEKKNFKEINVIFQNTFFLVFFNSIFFLLLWIVIFLIDQFSLKAFEVIKYNDIKLIFLLIVFSAHCTILDQLFYCGITYNGDASKYNYNNLLFDTLIKVLIPVAGLLTDNLINAVVIFSILQVFKTISLYIIFKIQNKNNLKLKLDLFDISSSFKIFKLSLSYQLENFSHILRNNGLIILIGIFFSPVIVGLISTAKTLFYFLPIRFLDTINSTLHLEFSKVYGRNDMTTLKKIYKLHIYIYIFVLFIFFISSLFFGKLVYDFWTNYKYDLSYSLLILIIVDSIMFNFYNSAEIFIKSINKFLYSSILKSFLALVTILLSYILFSLEYSFLSFFFISIISSFFILFLILLITFKIFNTH
ncbi:MAG: hypothetical protein CMI79_00145 [Candidatus Pelagibacter sp.]|nr:hypothetical protein [Candidatus Pelagibacter sp.]|tara:strand:+ start:1989 stop:3305 length:1317 start_codon:yes stop_codon:yes gene_type:complete